MRERRDGDVVVSPDVTLREPALVRAGLVALPVASALAALLLGADWFASAAGIAPVFAAALVGATPYFVRSERWRRGRGSLERTDGGLHVRIGRHAVRVSYDELVDAWTTARPSIVLLLADGRRLEVETAVLTQDATRFVEALPAQTSAPSFGLVQAPLAPRGRVAWIGGATGRVTVGRDGLALLNGGAACARFIPFAEVTNVVDDPGGLTLELVGGGSVAVPLIARPSEGASPRLGPRRVALVGAAVRRALAVHGEARARPDVVGALARGGRDIRGWVDGVVGIASGAPGYRAHRFDDDDLARVVESTDAPSEARIGAALALSIRSKGDLQRLRAFVAGSVDARLRIALEQAAAGKVDEATFEAVTAEAAEARGGASRRVRRRSQ